MSCDAPAKAEHAADEARWPFLRHFYLGEATTAGGDSYLVYNRPVGIQAWLDASPEVHLASFRTFSTIPKIHQTSSL